ncbi:hypothetical protein PAXINDRAFT_18672 [Paxillus involutus ATCC 200175]|uniref:Uncharacterized protein n=1 Tax=Paxillus involutus ATCC 200175 TaxID=664439 RepID=A0A0C9TLK7_PAXIN|nr:hypothetical protein PAXINDRAFT_18672 [Paxillus involutus ATCC 200175]
MKTTKNSFANCPRDYSVHANTRRTTCFYTASTGPSSPLPRCTVTSAISTLADQVEQLEKVQGKV